MESAHLTIFEKCSPHLSIHDVSALRKQGEGMTRMLEHAYAQVEIFLEDLDKFKEKCRLHELY